MQLSTDAKKKLAEWMTGDDVGMSSMSIAVAAATGHIPFNCASPHDLGDLGRCARLVDQIPEVREIAFPILSEASEDWKNLVSGWDELFEVMQDKIGLDFSKAPYMTKRGARNRQQVFDMFCRIKSGVCCPTKAKMQVYA